MTTARVNRLAPNDTGADLYIIQSENGWIKVGRSSYPQKRLAQLQAAQVSDLLLVHVAPGMGDTEVALLTALAGRRVRGEWVDGTLASRKTIEGHIGRALHWPYGTPVSLAARKETAVSGQRDEVLSPKEAAKLVGLSMPAFYKAVAAERLPFPFYPAPRAPRWHYRELMDALEKTRQRPRDAVQQRMTARRARMLPERRLADVSPTEGCA